MVLFLICKNLLQIRIVKLLHLDLMGGIHQGLDKFYSGKVIPPAFCCMAGFCFSLAFADSAFSCIFFIYKCIFNEMVMSESYGFLKFILLVIIFTMTHV